jgi:hypothetical protein
MELVLSMSIFFVIITMIFVAVAVFLPEWMGITGKKAKKIIEDQQSAHSEQHSDSKDPKEDPNQKH